MKEKYFSVLILFLPLFFLIACNNASPAKSKIKGNWRSDDGKIGLKITEKEFTLIEGEEPIAENYFVKGDTIFTSYEGTEPYTKFAIKDLSDKSFTLIYPDSTSVKFVR